MKNYDVAELAQTLFEESGDALFLFHPQTEKLIDVNPMAQRLCGQSRRQLLELDVTYLFRTDQPGSLQRLRHAFHKTGVFHAQDGFFLRQQAPGQWLPVNLTIARLHTDTGTLGLLTARDMTDQRQAQALLKKKEAELRQVLCSVSDCLWSAAADAAGQWKLAYCSPVVERITGHGPEFFEAGLAAWLTIAHPEDQGRLREAFARLQRGAPQVELDYRIVRPDGAVVWVRGSVQAAREQGGGLRLDGILTDISERKSIETRLRESEEKHRDLVETSNDLIWSVDAEGRWTFVNRKAARAIYGYEPEEMLGRPFVDFLAPELRDRDLATFERVKAGEPAFRYATTHVRKDGALVQLSFNAVVSRDAAGRILGTRGTASDVTKSMHAEASLRASEQRYRLLFERNLAGVFRSTAEGELLDVNDSMARILGYDSREDLLATSPLAFYVDPDHRDRLLWDLREQGHLTNYEVRLRRRDGTPIWALENVSMLHDERGREVLEGTIVDISRQKRHEESLRASEAKYRCLIENLDQCIFLKDSELRFVAANENFCRGLGLAEADLLGKTDLDLYPAALAEKYRADDLIVLREGRAVQAEEENLQQGQRLRVRVHKTPVKDDSGQTVGVLGIFWDITEQTALEAQVRQMQKMEAIGQLAGGVAHDFNNLLTVILGNLSFVLSKSPEADAAREMLRSAEQAGLRAAELTRRLLTFSRRTPLRSEPVNLNQAVEECIAFLRRTIDPRIQIAFAPHADLWLTEADCGQINQVLMNLAVNARDAMPQGGELLFETANVVIGDDYCRAHLASRPGAFVRLRVRDTGCGMPADVRAHIFEPFFTTKEPGKGTGLGLANVFGIVRQHKGWIDCVSEPGAGTSFDIYLPRGCAAQVERPPETPAPAAAAGGTILLVDDEPMIRALGDLALRRCGFRVLLAEDGLEGVNVFREHHRTIDLVILDGTMPQLSGKEALRKMIEIEPKVRALFSSGFAAEHLGLGDFEQVVDFIHKPYRVEDLAAKVRANLVPRN